MPKRAFSDDVCIEIRGVGSILLIEGRAVAEPTTCADIAYRDPRMLIENISMEEEDSLDSISR